MRAFRSVLFWMHLTAGVVGGAIILLMSVTGVLLTYEKQMIAWADRRAVGGPLAIGAERQPVGALVDAAAAVEPSAPPASVIVPADPTAAVQVSFGRGRQLFVNPYTAQVLGPGATTFRTSITFLVDWHRWLGTTGEGRATARAITGAANLAFLFLVLSGLWLWFPRKWTRIQFRNVLFFRGGLRGKARDFNWHHVLGIWSFVPLVLIVASGAVISYPWASNLVYRVMGEAPPPSANRAPPPASNGGRSGGDAAPAPVVAPAADLAPLDQLLARASAQVDGWRLITLTLPKEAGTPVSFSIDRGNGGQPQHRATLVLDATTGDVTSWQPFSAQTPGRRLRSFLRFAHTGEFFGVTGQTIAGLVSFASVVLVWTGIALAWRRVVRAITSKERDEAELPAGVPISPTAGDVTV